MSEEEIARGETVIASVGVVLYRNRRHEGQIEVLVAERQKEPWKGYTALVFGGLVKETDENVPAAAKREGREEAGETLSFAIKRPVGIYGPQIYFHELALSGDSELTAMPTAIPISDKHFVIIVYAAEVLSGTPTENEEMRKFRFVSPLVLAEERRELAFGDALVLANFWYRIRHDPSWTRPEITRLIYGSPD